MTKAKPDVFTEIGIVLYPHALMSAVYGLTDLFVIANRMAMAHPEMQRPEIRVTHWQEMAGGKVVRVYDTEPEAAGASQPSFLLVPPSFSDPISHAEAVHLAGWIEGMHAGGTVLGSVCAGSFLLAETGLLKGRAVTTHWSFLDGFQARFPDIALDGGQLLIDEGDIITSGGMMAWTDLGLRIVQRLFGPTVMLETARFMIVDPPGREQRYYSRFSPQFSHGDVSVVKVQHWLHAQGGKEVSVQAMAKKAGLEPRTFLRRFQKATGMRPTEYCQQLRVSKAKEMLEFSGQSIEQVAWAVGYEDAGAFRKIFARVTGLSPGHYRERFGLMHTI